MASREVFHFDEFTLDVQERRLLRGAEAVHLSPKAYDVLVALVRQRGRMVTKDELLRRIWPESFVEEGSLTVHMSGIMSEGSEAGSAPKHAAPRKSRSQHPDVLGSVAMVHRASEVARKRMSYTTCLF